ncbi:MAG TPA: thiamine phosphate synthase, partial [Geminicoccaceae bacterium]|nr:thiamine phosphate synthase [Geminicoccaceae bacterium]
LISPPELDPAGFEAQLAAALAAGGSAGFLLRLTDPGGAARRAAALRLRPVCSARSVAFLLQDEVDLALEVGVDGVHLGAPEAVRAARAALGPERILGVACGGSRHAAMVAGDAGADYIAFGDPEVPPACEVHELVAWWSELFVLPCLAEGGASLGECSALARAGADFVGVSALVWQDARGPAASVAELRRAIAR